MCSDNDQLINWGNNKMIRLVSSKKWNCQSQDKLIIMAIDWEGSEIPD